MSVTNFAVNRVLWQVGPVATAGEAAPRTGGSQDAGTQVLGAILGTLVTVVPFAVAVMRASSAGQWRDDVPAVRDLGLVGVGIGGGVSTLVTQALTLAPLGPLHFRAALGSAVALAIAARALYGIVRLAVAGAGGSPKLGTLIAAIATMTAALSPAWQREATGGGGAMIAAALALTALAGIVGLGGDPSAGDASPDEATRARRQVFLVAILVGALFAENWGMGIALLAMAVVRAAIVPRTVTVLRAAMAARGALVFGLGTATAVALALAAPALLRPQAPNALLHLGSLPVLGGGPSASDGPGVPAVMMWLRELGLVSFAIAAFGAGVALLRAEHRAIYAALFAAIVLDTILPSRGAAALQADPRTALSVVAGGSIAASSAVGLYDLVRRVSLLSFPLARAAAVLLVTFHLAFAAMASEDAGMATDRSDQFAAETWTDVAFGEVAPRAAILVKSQAFAWRLWAARIARGERPDVLVIPVPMLDRAPVAEGLLMAERDLTPLVRSFALTGEPTEYGLSKLADARTLYTEYDPVWSKRLVSHLRVDGLWLEYAPQPLGPSDRRLSTAASGPRIARVAAAILSPTVPEAHTGAVVGTMVQAHADVLDALGDRDAAAVQRARVENLVARDPDTLRVRTAYARKGLKRVLVQRGILGDRDAPNSRASSRAHAPR